MRGMNDQCNFFYKLKSDAAIKEWNSDNGKFCHKQLKLWLRGECVSEEIIGSSHVFKDGFNCFFLNDPI